MKPLDKCAICGDSITDDQIELSYCPYCLTAFHFKCIKKHLFRESKCPECGKTATLLTFGHGPPRKLTLPSAFEKKKEEKFDEVDALLKTEPSKPASSPKPAETLPETEKEPETLEEFLEEEETWEEDTGGSRWIAIALIILLFLAAALVGAYYIWKGSFPW